MNDGLWLWPWEECGEVFFGWMEPGQINGMDFTIARRCNLPKDHRGSCDFCRVYPAGFFPRGRARVSPQDPTGELRPG